MNRILRHVGNKDFKRTRQRQIDEQRELATQKLKEQQKEELERKEIEEAARPYKSDWRSELNEAMTTSGLGMINYPATGENINDTISMGSNDSFSPDDTDISGNLWGIDTTYSTNHNQPNNVFPGFSDGDGVLYFSVPVTDTRGYGATVDYYSMTTKPMKLENDTVSFRAIAGNSTLVGKGMGSNGGSQPYRDLSVSWYSYENGMLQDFGTLGTISRFTDSDTQFEFKFPPHLIGKEVAINFFTDANTGGNEAASFLEGFPIPWHPLGTLDERSFGDTSNTYAWFILNYDDIQGQGYAVDSKTTLALRLWQDLQAKYTSTSAWGRTLNDRTFDNPGAPAPISGSRYNFGLEHPETGQMIGMTQADLDYIVAWIQTNMLYLRGQTTTTYAITDLNFKRRTPANVFVALDDPKANSFMRGGLGGDKERRKRLKDQLESSNELMTRLGLDPSKTSPGDIALDTIPYEEPSPGPGGYKPPGSYDPNKFYNLDNKTPMPSPNLPSTGPGRSSVPDGTKVAASYPKMDPLDKLLKDIDDVDKKFKNKRPGTRPGKGRGMGDTWEGPGKIV